MNTNKHDRNDDQMNGMGYENRNNLINLFFCLNKCRIQIAAPALI